MKNYIKGSVEKFKGLSQRKQIFLGVITGLCFIFLVVSTIHSLHSSNALTKLEKVEKKPVNRMPADYTSDIDNVRQVSPNELLNFRKEAINKGYQKNYRGYVSIPEIGMYLPILNGVNMYALSLGAASYYPNTRTMGDYGNYVLAGHNMDTSQNVLFSRLPNVSIGKESKIILTDGSKNYYYHVISKETVSPKQKVFRGTSSPTKDSILYNDKSKKTVTLFTCNYNGSKRIVVKGDFDYETTLKEGE